jgi:hypothetical protein
MLLSQLTVPFHATRQVLERFVARDRFVIGLFQFDSAALIVSQVHGSTVAQPTKDNNKQKTIIT